VTDALVDALVRKATVLMNNRRYFGWKGLGFQCSACYETTLTLCNPSELMGKDSPEAMRKDPPKIPPVMNDQTLVSPRQKKNDDLSSDLEQGNVTKSTVQPDEQLSLHF